MLDIRGLFTREAIVRYLTALPVMKTPIMDSLFVNRPQLAMPIIGVHEIKGVVHALPVVKRGSASIPATRDTGQADFYEPLPVKPNTFVGGMDLNNLKLLGQNAKDTWAQGKADLLRRGVRKTTEALCSQALGGKIDWAVQMEAGGFERWVIDFGNPLSVVPAKKWDAEGVRLADVFETLTNMQEALEAEGYGGEIEIQASGDVYNVLFGLAENSKTTAKIRVEITDQGINIGGFLIRRRAEKYRDPETRQMQPVLPAKTVRMVARDADHRLIYAAVDDLDANLQPLPMFIKPLKKDDPSGWMLVGESKPFPVPNMRGICTAQVLA